MLLLLLRTYPPALVLPLLEVLAQLLYPPQPQLLLLPLGHLRHLCRRLRAEFGAGGSATAATASSSVVESHRERPLLPEFAVGQRCGVLCRAQTLAVLPRRLPWRGLLRVGAGLLLLSRAPLMIATALPCDLTG